MDLRKSSITADILNILSDCKIHRSQDIADEIEVSNNFRLLLKRNNLKHIRFHDLRHSCASLLLANNVPMKNIQEWLGHANYSTTADVYSHLDFSSKIRSGDIIGTQLSEYDYKDALSKKDLGLEIKRLNRLLEEKQALLNKKKNCRQRNGITPICKNLAKITPYDTIRNCPKLNGIKPLFCRNSSQIRHKAHFCLLFSEKIVKIGYQKSNPLTEKFCVKEFE